MHLRIGPETQMDSKTQLFILSKPDLFLARKIATKYPTATCVFWSNSATDLVSLRCLAESCVEIYAGASILNEVSVVLKSQIYPFDENPMGGGNDGQALSDSAPSICRPIAFFAANDTIATMFKGIVRSIDAPHLFITPTSKNEGVLAVLLETESKIYKNSSGIMAKVYPSILVLGNDWGDEEKDLIASATRLGVPSICIQEGCLDWTGELRRMQWAAFAFIQGALTLKYLKREIYFLTGNPRFDALDIIPLPSKHKVMINCNFTYGVFEESRDAWVKDVVDVCCDLGLDYFISQHPRDRGNLTGYSVKRSHAGVVHTQIAESTIIVSRFSTVIYEAAIMGRQVIYYNPHGEMMQTFNQDTTEGLHKVFSVEELKKILAELVIAEKSFHYTDDFIRLHCGTHKSSSNRCAVSISIIGKWHARFPPRSLLNRVVCYIQDCWLDLLKNAIWFARLTKKKLLGDKQKRVP